MNKNILISGWPGAGATTLSLILAKALNYKLLRGTESFRELGRRLKKADTGVDRIQIDNYLEPYFGPVFDKYIDYKLINDQKLIIEADIGAFRLGKREEFLSIFLYTDIESRKKRLEIDNRSEDIEVVQHREIELQKRYKELHDIDWFDVNLIKDKYDLILQNSSMTIHEELKLIFEKIEIDLSLNYNKLEEEFWQNGKNYYVKYLSDKNLLMDGDEVIEEIKKLFAEEIKKFPDQLKKII